MSRAGSASINLDDIFGAVTTSPAYVNVPAEANHEVPPEPRSRVTTAASYATESSKASTVKEVPVAVTAVSHAAAHYDEPPSHRNSISHKNTVGADSLLDHVFAAVTLPPVELGSRPQSYQQRHQEVDYAIRHLDDALDGEDSAVESESLVSEPAYKAPSSHVSSRHSAIPQNHSSYYSSSVVSNQNGSSHYNPPGREDPLPDYDDNELYDKFESNKNYPPSKAGQFRGRTNTLDSSVSFAESRVGGFDVHDEHDQYTGSDINLSHNEVAYDRPQPKSAASSLVSQNSRSTVHTGGTYKLSQLNRELEEARYRQHDLSHKVEREQAEIDRLRQQNLAKEAAFKVHRIGMNGQQPNFAQNYQKNQLPRQHSVGSGVSYHGPATISSRSTKSVDSSIYEEEPARTSPIAARQKAAGEFVARVGKFELIVPQFRIVGNFSKNNRINKVIVGGDAAATDDDKTILLFGPVGSGKTSVINSCLNYLYDVKKENEFRFVLDEEVHHTTGLTAYVFNNTVLQYNVTIVDTPGVVNKEGNRTVSTLIKQWFEQELLQAHAFRMDAISIVLNHDEKSLDWPFIYELAAVKKMFGDDLKTNVLPIITNSEVLPQPRAITSLARANIAFLEYYKVNNLGFMPEAKGISKLQHNLFFTHGIASLEALFQDLQELVHPLVAILRHSQGKKVEPAPVLSHATLY
ncbi:unnamed protein product [Caenorhabditis auriculariae]|uniref:G domain-containing protein n=1 Tax=Caenorhabditis auriculariae TaxID=2777116 RepID=A0A8S1H5G1_9PELO|nr:unnamed protein product [Caenorhabditis auriculariae]